MDFAGVTLFPGDTRATTPKCQADVGDLRLLLEIKDRMEDGVAGVGPRTIPIAISISHIACTN